MTRSRSRQTTSALATVLVVSGLATACGGGSANDTARAGPTGEDEQESTEKTLREGEYPEYDDVKLAFTDVSKRLVGLDPKSEELRYYGMVHLADQLGFGWTWNWCAPSWDVLSSRDGAISLTSNHQTGSGYGCSDGPKRDDPAKYTFSDWILADAKAVKIPWSRSDLPGEGTQAELTEDGEIKVVEPIVVEADSGLNKTSQNVKLVFGVDQAITVSRAVMKGWKNSYEAGVSVAAQWKAGIPLLGETSVTTTFSFKYTHEDNGSTTDTETETVTPKCSFDVTVPPGCHYKGKITVSKVKKAARYKVYAVAKPQSATISGFMRWGDSHGCMRRGNKDGDGRDIDGHCERDHVDETFGANTGMLFYEDIARQRRNDSGNWYWHLMTGIADYQDGSGKPTVDAIIGNLQNDAIYQFSLPFVAAYEDVTKCDLSLEVDSDSTGDCTAPPPGSKPAK